MAQAPQGGGGGAPRQNKTVKDFKGMNTQNRRNAIPEGAFGWLENIQPIGPGHLHSIPGRGGSVVEIPPAGNCAPGQQIINYERRFAQNRVDTNTLHVSWSHISQTEELYMYSGDITSDGGNMNYDNVLSVLEHFSAPRPLGDPPVPTVSKITSPIGDYGTINTMPGEADEPMYASANASNKTVLYRINPASSILLPDASLAGMNGAAAFAKEGNELFVMGNNDVTTLAKFDLTGNLLQTNTTSFATANHFPIHMTISPNFIYVLVEILPAPAHQVVFKFARSNILALVDTIELGAIDANLIAAVDDDFFFVGGMLNARPHRLYYWDGQLRYVGTGTALDPLDPQTGVTTFNTQAGSVVLTFGTGLAEQRFFYWGSGITPSDTDVWRMGPMACAVPPLNPSVSGPATGAIGGSANITWAGILEPTDTVTPSFGDYVVLLPAADFFSYPTSDGITVQRQYTAGLAGGTMAFAIPGTMTPGDYRIWLGARNINTFMAKGGIIALS